MQCVYAGPVANCPETLVDYGWHAGFKIASIIDEHTRVLLDDTVDVSITDEDLVGIL